MEQYASGCDVDDDVWVYTNEERSSWLTGKITNISANIVDVQIRRGGQPHEPMQVPWDRIIRHQKRSTKGIADAEEATPDEFGEIFMVETLQERFNTRLPSMKAGPFLVCLRGDCVKGLDQDPMMFGRSPAQEAEQPTPAKMAVAAYEKCLHDKTPQTIVCTGVSGSGKSWTCNAAMGALYECGRKGSIGSQVVQQVFDAAKIVLDAFSNCSTAANPDSSRSARNYSLFYDARGTLVGGSVHSLFLDVGRLTRKPAGEGPFHIMLQMCYGAWASEREMLKLKPINEFKLLENSPRSAKLSAEMAAAYNNTRDAMSRIRLTTKEQQQLLQTVSGILHLGNLSFCGTNCDPFSQEVFDQTAALLEVPPQQLLAAFAEKEIKYNDRSMVNKRRPENATALVPMIVEFLYSATFEWLITRVNAALSCYDAPTHMINVVDPCGFERSASNNTFDQLCINYMDEKFKAALIRRLFCLDTAQSNEVLEQEQLMAYLESSQKTKVQVEQEMLPDQLTIQLFEGPGGVLPIFEKESASHSGSSKTVHDSFYPSTPQAKMARNSSKNKAMSKLVKELDLAKDPTGLFCLKHSMGTVTYHEPESLAPNIMNVPPAIKDLLSKSKLPCLSKIVNIGSEALQNGKLTVLDTLAKKMNTFHASMDLMVASATSNEFIQVACCIRPNLSHKPDFFEPSAVLQQLRAWSVCQAVHFRQIFSENVISAPVFTTKWTSQDLKMANEAKQSAMVAAFTDNLAPPSELATSSQKNILKWLNNVDQTRAALKIQSAYRRWVVRLKYRRLGTLFERIQTEVRRLIILEKHGKELLHDKAMQRCDDLQKAIKKEQAQREASSKAVQGEPALTCAEIRARKIERIIAETQMLKEQGQLVTKANVPDIKEIADDWCDQSATQPVRNLRNQFDDYEYQPDGEATSYIQEDPFSGSVKLKKVLLKSIATDLNLEQHGAPPLHKTMQATNGYYMDPSQLVHYPPSAVGVNCPTSVAPTDLFACVNKFAANHTDENWSQPPPQPQNPQRKIQPDSEPLPPPPRRHEIVPVVTTSPKQYGPSGAYGKRYRQKYKFRKNLDEPTSGYQSADSSCSEDSVDSSASDDFSDHEN